MAPSDIEESDVLRAIAECERLGPSEFRRIYKFGVARDYRLVHRGQFYDSKAIAGVAHGFATREFWTGKKPFGGVAPNGAVTILRNLGFFVDDGELNQLANLQVDRSHGRPAPYQYVLLLWAIANARSGQPRAARFLDVQDELAELLAPFALTKAKPDPSMPWQALRSSGWWEYALPSEPGYAEFDEDSRTQWAGLSPGIYQRVIVDDAFVGATVDVIATIIGSEPGFLPLLNELDLAHLLSAETSTRNSSDRVNWSWDELVLACALLASNGWQRFAEDDPRVAELSEFLQARSVGSVLRKLENIRTMHPSHPGKPTKGGKLTLKVIEAFIADPNGMDDMAQALRRNGDLARPDQVFEVETEPEGATTDEFVSAIEGRVIERQVRVAERNPKLRKAKIDQALKERGCIACEICDFNFEAFYGERGTGYIHVHHKMPLHLTREIENRLDDLILLCANCHVMIHRSPWMTPEQLRAAIAETRLSQP